MPAVVQRITGAFILLLLVACGPPRSINDYVHTNNVRQIRAGISYLEDHRAGRQLLTELSGHESSIVRASAMLALGRNEDIAAQPIVMSGLKDRTVEVRRMAAFSLGQLGDGRVEPALLSHLTTELHPVVRRTIWQALARVGTGLTLGVAQRIDGVDKPVAIITAGLILRRLKRSPVSVPWFVESLTDSDPEVRAAAFYGFSRVHPTLSLPQMVRNRAVVALGSESGTERETATRVLSRGVEGVETELATVIRDGGLTHHQQATVIRGLKRTKTALATQLLVELAAVSAPYMYVGPGLLSSRYHVTIAAITALRKRELTDSSKAKLREIATLFQNHKAKMTSVYRRRWDRLVCQASLLFQERNNCSDFQLVKHSDKTDELKVFAQHKSARIRIYALHRWAEIESIPEAALVHALGDSDLPVAATAATVMKKAGPAARKALISAWTRAFDARDLEAAGDILKTMIRFKIKQGRFAFEQALQSGRASLAKLGAAGLHAITGTPHQVPTRSLPAFDLAQMNAYWLSDKPLRTTIKTEVGDVVIALEHELAPRTVRSFVALARKGYFNGLSFHRVVPNFVVQGGDPRGDGWGGPGFTLRCENNPIPYITGTMGMALAGKDTGGSQFFVTHSAQPHLLGTYTVFGRILKGMPVINRLVPGDRILSVVIND